jgi:hypothetical protein
VKPPASVAVPEGVVTVTSAGPNEPAGVTAVRVVSSTTVTEVAEMPPSVTSVASTKFDPWTVMAVPPPSGPAEGTIDVTDGAHDVQTSAMQLPPDSDSVAPTATLT